MKDSIRLMEIYRKYLEATGDLVEVLESHCKLVEANHMSSKLKQKYADFRKHTQHLINSLNDDLHMMLKIDYELKDIEKLKDKRSK